ncbi:MAG: EAL domain-containing protein [Steroidobacteraceae bacterium]|nr:EAL domain-containing protein [Deltaproteobacteria bacterium]
MKSDKDKSLPADSSELRRQAEKRLHAKTADLHPPRTRETMQCLVHELEVHQIELEMQNEELCITQEELEVSRNTYAELYDFAPVGYFTFDACGLIREVNLTGAKLLGLDRRELIKKPFSSFIADADGREIFPSHLASVMQVPGMQKCEIKLSGKDGSTVHGQLQSVALDDIERKDGYILSSIVDGTAGKQMEEERARLALIVESSSDAIYSISLDDVITSWNRGAENIFGYSASEIIGSQIFTVIPSDRCGERHRILQTILSGEHVQHFETSRVRKDGTQIHVSITTSPLLNTDGKIIGNSVIARDVTERRKLEELIKHQAHHDTLTNLPNRQLFMDFLSQGLSQARRDGKKLALMFLDLNGFKQINDTLGHSCGDRLLQEVAHRLSDCIRETDTVARLGGDEFTVLMPDLGHTDDVGVVLKKILGVFESPFMLDDIAVDNTTSIGVCMYPEDGESSEELMKKADIAMYDAKGSGRNSYKFYNSEINARTIKRQKMEGFLRQALNRDELELLFQPMVCCDTSAIIGAEALLRWRHPEQGLLAPDQFLEIAEDSGAIVPIGEWVIRNACEQIRAWNKMGYPLNVSVNLSNRQFHQSDLVEKTALILAETGLNPHQLEFDITEESIMADIDYSLLSLQALADMGVTLAIDNFGTGSSSLNWIKKMQTQKVKIDKSFVQNMLSEPDDLAIVNAVIAMSHNLKMTVVANGVETKDQLSVIRQSGCDQLQGYVISKPLIPAEFERLVANF